MGTGNWRRGLRGAGSLEPGQAAWKRQHKKHWRDLTRLGMMCLGTAQGLRVRRAVDNSSG